MTKTEICDKLYDNFMEIIKLYRDDYVDKPTEEEETFSVGDIIWVEEPSQKYIISSNPDNTIRLIRLDDNQTTAGFYRWGNDAVTVIHGIHVTREELAAHIGVDPFGKVGRYDELVK